MEQLTYQEYRAEWLEMRPNRRPVRPEPQRNYPKWFGAGALTMFVCAAILSGVHTVPAIFAGIETVIPLWIRILAALSSFGAIELSIFNSSYILAGNKRSIVMWLTLIFSLALAMLTNVQSNLAASGRLAAEISIDLGFVQFIGVFMGVLIPSLSATAGKGFVAAHKDEVRANKVADDALTALNNALDEEIALAYTGYTNNLRKSAERRERDEQRRIDRLSAPVSANRTAETRKSATESPLSADLPQLGSAELAELYRETPELLRLSLPELKQRYRLEKSTYYKARDIVRHQPAAPISENGNGAAEQAAG